jgi:hypothetical protein
LYMFKVHKTYLYYKWEPKRKAKKEHFVFTIFLRVGLFSLVDLNCSYIISLVLYIINNKHP